MTLTPCDRLLQAVNPSTNHEIFRDPERVKLDQEKVKKTLRDHQMKELEN